MVDAVRDNPRPLEVAVVRFPGSNCDFDTLRFFQRAGHNAKFLWHAETKVPEADLLVLPGGFAFGDRVYERATASYTIDPGIQALKSPVKEVVYRWNDEGKPILGICNGFQVLVHAGVLSGSLIQNDSGRFFCDDVDVRVEGESFFGDELMKGNVYRVPVAHGYGRYKISVSYADGLESKDRVFLRYHGFNPNGSDEDIAGVCNQQGNVFGMMPHPERAMPKVRDAFMAAIEKYVSSR